MSRIKWTDSMDRHAREMATAGKSVSEIAAALYIKKEQVYSRLAYLKQKGYVIGGLDGRTMPRMEKGASAPTENIADPAGKLNDLEAAMAETIEELTGEKAALVDEIAGLKILLNEEQEKNRCLAEKYGQERAAVTIELENLRRETDEARSLLEQTEKQYDNACVEAKVQLAKVKDQADIISRLEGQVKDLTERLERMCSAAQTDAERNKGQIQDLNWRLERAAKEAGRLYELILLTETQITFSPFCEE